MLVDHMSRNRPLQPTIWNRWIRSTHHHHSTPAFETQFKRNTFENVKYKNTFEVHPVDPPSPLNPCFSSFEDLVWKNTFGNKCKITFEAYLVYAHHHPTPVSSLEYLNILGNTWETCLWENSFQDTFNTGSYGSDHQLPRQYHQTLLTNQITFLSLTKR